MKALIPTILFAALPCVVLGQTIAPTPASEPIIGRTVIPDRLIATLEDYGAFKKAVILQVESPTGKRALFRIPAPYYDKGRLESTLVSAEQDVVVAFGDHERTRVLSLPKVSDVDVSFKEEEFLDYLKEHDGDSFKSEAKLPEFLKNLYDVDQKPVFQKDFRDRTYQLMKEIKQVSLETRELPDDVNRPDRGQVLRATLEQREAHLLARLFNDILQNTVVNLEDTIVWPDRGSFEPTKTLLSSIKLSPYTVWVAEQVNNDKDLKDAAGGNALERLKRIRFLTRLFLEDALYPFPKLKNTPSDSQVIVDTYNILPFSDLKPVWVTLFKVELVDGFIRRP